MKLTPYEKVGHVLSQYFLNCGGLLKGIVRVARYRRTQIPKDELEIPVVRKAQNFAGGV